MSVDTSPKDSRQETRSVAEQAADWVVELADGGAQEHAAFLEWVKESPRHVEEYLLAATVYRSLNGVDGAREIDVDAALAEASLNVVALGAGGKVAPAQKLRSRRQRLFAAAAAVTLAVAVSTAWWMFGMLPTWSTELGELRSVELTDGSVIDLNTQSQIRVHFSDRERSVRLLAGEALFNIAPDATRPFVVYADKATIRVLGTRFNVYQRPGDTAVSVIEGAVQISSVRPASSVGDPAATETATTRLIAGKGARVSASGAITRVDKVDPEKVTAWRDRRLVFVDDTLADIVAEFNRYNASPRLRVEGAFANERQLTAVFDAGDPQSLVQFVRTLGEFSVDTTDEEILIRER
jgi:transmembrane sensor